MRRLCLSHSEVAARFNIRNIGCIGQWESSYHHGGFEALAPRVRGKLQATSMTKPAPEPTQPLLSRSTDLPGLTQLPSREDLQSEVNHLRMEVAYLKKLQALVQTQARNTAPRSKRKS